MGSLPTNFAFPPHPLMPATGHDSLQLANTFHGPSELVPFSAPPVPTSRQLLSATAINVPTPGGSQEEPIMNLPLVPAPGSHPIHPLSTSTSVAAAAAAAVASGMFGAPLNARFRYDGTNISFPLDTSAVELAKALLQCSKLIAGEGAEFDWWNLGFSV